MCNRLLNIVVLLIVTLFWASSLSFFPVPWPDDSAFYLTGIDFIKWPPSYRMHSQAAFVPTYDVANFNTMPLLPMLLGIGRYLGVGTSHAIRIWGMLALAAWAICLGLWMKKRNLHTAWIWLVVLAAVLSPPIRWGAMVVRTEIWEGLLWLLILMELDGFFSSKLNYWRLSVFLALAAYFHFEAVVWVLPAGLALLVYGKRRMERVWGVFWRTLLFMTPWLLYVVWHWDVFWIQMVTQFGRLHNHPNTYVQDAYNLFHYMFFSLGNPVSYPKFFNLGKMITWIVVVVALMVNLFLLFRTADGRGTRIAAVAAIGATTYLWFTKPEAWFVTMIHLCAWPLLVLALQKFKPAVAVVLGVLIVLEIGVTVHQLRETQSIFTWTRYNQWIDCIEQSLERRTRIWQPHWPDVLVELVNRNPKLELTRSVDFENIDVLIQKHAENSEAIIHSALIESNDSSLYANYSGQSRDLDRNIWQAQIWIPFKKYSAFFSKAANESLYICQSGPFWAAVTLRN